MISRDQGATLPYLYRLTNRYVPQALTYFISESFRSKLFGIKYNKICLKRKFTFIGKFLRPLEYRVKIVVK
jgi:hypothetical protein